MKKRHERACVSFEAEIPKQYRPDLKKIRRRLLYGFPRKTYNAISAADLYLIWLAHSAAHGTPWAPLPETDTDLLQAIRAQSTNWKHYGVELYDPEYARYQKQGAEI
jgi:hypothetical protein